MRLLVAFLTAATLTACGPVQSTTSLIDADVDVEAARAAGAQTAAPYEYTTAEAYLHKSRELAGYAHYEASADYAAKASQVAKDAKVKALAASNKGEKEPAP